MNVDKISQLCVYCDYPLLRYHHQKYGGMVNKTIVYPSRHHGYIDLEDFMKKEYPVTWVNPVPIDWSTENWRQAETDPCLKESTAEWVWFSEPDFFVKNWDKFYEDIEKAMKISDMIGWYNPTNFPYVHPCCLFIKRELLEKTSKDFKAHPEINGADHFSMITHDVQELDAQIITLQDLGYNQWENAFHLGGLTYPYQNWTDEGTNTFGVGNVSAFFSYNHFIRQLPVVQHDGFMELSNKIENEIGKVKVKLNAETGHWKEYFT